MAVHSTAKNIWVAAGDGDLNRVRELIDHHSISPNVPDANTYTPMHAAASYGQIEVLEYLLSHGGNINVTDDDGDTPLYTVEDIETAGWLVENGAIVDRLNHEGISPIEHLREDFVEVANFLESMVSASTSNVDSPQSVPQPSQHAQNAASEDLTTSLMASVQDIMQRAEIENRDPEEELRQAVSRVVLDGVITGFQMTTYEDEDHENEHDDIEMAPAKRSRTDGEGS